MATKATARPQRLSTARPASAGCDDSQEMTPADNRDEARRRLARASGQVAGISRMIDDGRHCAEVMQQLAAVQKALDAVGDLALRDYFECCVTTAMEGRDPLTSHNDLMAVLTRYRLDRS